jgi:hypothetical protein
MPDAELFMDTMNFSMIKDRPCRTMWSRRDPTFVVQVCIFVRTSTVD